MVNVRLESYIGPYIYGSYLPNSKIIEIYCLEILSSIPKILFPQFFLITLIHELCHWLIHKLRLPYYFHHLLDENDPSGTIIMKGGERLW